MVTKCRQMLIFETEIHYPCFHKISIPEVFEAYVISNVFLSLYSSSQHSE
ncbi:hypothetical protein HanRHA438_Chr08g0331071 [Helianthus annuus]|nr:hypothetical protein HanRHA438_Chr08g0331071 [Helianthus annuus]